VWGKSAKVALGRFANFFNFLFTVKHFVIIILLCVFNFHPYYATFHNENLKKIVA
jgi:hypothetical protein